MTTPQQILDLPLPVNDAGAATVRDYLLRLLAEVWRQEEGFSGKRPFGNSCWQYEVYAPMIEAGMVDGQLDEDGYLDDCDFKAADRLIIAAIRHLGASR